MIASCEICQGTGETFHPGQAQKQPCWKCEHFGNHVDAVVAYMRATNRPPDAAIAVSLWMFTEDLCVGDSMFVGTKARERLQ
jgi:hypothetical protein